MNFAIRVDSSRDIGTGHLMRCLTIAQSVRSHGHNLTFICGDHKDSFHSLAEAADFEVLVMRQPSPVESPGTDLQHSRWLGRCQTSDAKETIRLIDKANINWLIVDHYGIDERWQKQVRATMSNLKIMVIDDLADRHHDCDVLLDQNYYVGFTSRYDGLVPAKCLKLLGPAHAILRPDFFAWRSRTALRSGVPRKLLVFFGGSDAQSKTKATLEILAQMPQTFEVNTVLGINHPDEVAVRALCNEQYNWQLNVQSQKMAELMAHADLAIGASGATSWERCCVGLPTIITALADNQVKLAKDLSDFGAALYVDSNKSQWPQNLAAAIERFIREPALLGRVSAKAHDIMPNTPLDIASVFQTLC